MSAFAVVGAVVTSLMVFKLVSFIVRLLFTPPTEWGKHKEGWAIVTGSTDGIGKEFALQLAKKGLNIVLVARNADKLHTVQQQIMRETKVMVETAKVDFSTSTAKKDIEQLLNKLGDKKVSVLINNVGTSHDHPEYFTEASLETIENIINVNILNTLCLTRAVLPAMVDRHGGMILNLGSFSGETPIPLLQTYSASKSFLKTWSKALAAEVASQGVSVQLLNTYYVVSNMSKKKRPSMMVPTPERYVRAALRVAGQNDFCTPYPMHAMLYELMALVPDWIMTRINLSMMRAVRQAALQKAKRQ
jgi:17beta-estradiol 17-dehydrogenase / very-long-chain 3-oxoacyl-CoA reductase